MSSRWEFQFQQPSGNWSTVNQSNHETDQTIKLKLDQMERQYQGKRVRVICDGRIIDLR